MSTNSDSAQSESTQIESELNFSNFMERLNYEIERAKRFNHAMSVCIFSIDDEKEFNADRRGQLRQFAQIIRSVLRTVDLMVASSSDDLSIILPETSQPGAMVVAERVLTEVRKYQFPSGKTMTASASVGTYPDHAGEPQALANITLEALKTSQKQGGNKVTAVGQ